MAKFAGEIGFAHTVEVRPGIHQEVITVFPYYGDVMRKGMSIRETEHVNDEIHISNMISIVADEYLRENFSQIRFVKWDGGYWKISSVEVNRPRLILYFGGRYHGKTS